MATILTTGKLKPVNLFHGLAIAAAVAGLYFLSTYNYLLFHSLAEGFSVVIAFSIFAISWNARRFLRNNYLFFIGIAFLFIGGIDFLHTLAYAGMGVFQPDGANLATQLWMGARYLEAFTLIAAPFLFHRRIRPNLVFVGYAAVTLPFLLSVFYWKVFPAAFIEGQGLTSFKIVSEYVISIILLGAGFLLIKNKDEFDDNVFKLILASIILTIASELAFTLYTDAYGIANMVGHILKVVSFYLIYRALIVTGLQTPYDLLFRNLNQSEQKYHSLFSSMNEGFALYDVIWDETGRPVDYRFVEVNDAFCKMTGLEDVEGKKALDIIHGLENSWLAKFEHVTLTGQPAQFTGFVSGLGKGRWYQVFVYSPADGRLATLFSDVTRRMEMEEELRISIENLQEQSLKLEEEIEERKTIQQELARHRNRLEELVSQRTRKIHELSKRMLITQEKERQRIGHELHDEIGGLLTGLKLALHKAKKKLGEAADNSELGYVEELLNRTMETVSILSHSMRPEILDEMGLLEALRWHFEEYTRHTDIEIDFSHDGLDGRLPAEIETTAYRVIQESLTNVARYSGASRASVDIRLEDHKLLVEIEDLGRGFDPQMISATSLGLSGMQDRVLLAGGELIIYSSPGEGTRISCEINLEN